MKKIDKEELHQLFQKIKQKDKVAFDKLYEKYKNLIFNIAFCISKDHYISEEVVQIVFLKIFQMPINKLPSSYESSWLYTVTKNQTIELLRKRFNYIDIESIYDINSDNNEINTIIDKDSFNRIISGLDEKEKEIVSLKLLSNFTLKEIGEMLNIPTGTVQWKYYKSLHSLKLLIGNLILFILNFGLYIKTKGTSKESEIKSNNKDINSNAGFSVSPDSIMAETSVTTDSLSVSHTNIQISLLSFSAVFLVFTLVFSIIFAKHQQKRYKKTSKYYMGK